MDYYQIATMMMVLACLFLIFLIGSVIGIVRRYDRDVEESYNEMTRMQGHVPITKERDDV